MSAPLAPLPGQGCLCWAAHSCGLAVAWAGSSLPLPVAAFPRLLPAPRPGLPPALSPTLSAPAPRLPRGPGGPEHSSRGSGAWSLGVQELGHRPAHQRPPHFLLLELGLSWPWACPVTLSACGSVTAEPVALEGRQGTTSLLKPEPEPMAHPETLGQRQPPEEDPGLCPSEGVLRPSHPGSSFHTGPSPSGAAWGSEGLVQEGCPPAVLPQGVLSHTPGGPQPRPR